MTDARLRHEPDPSIGAWVRERLGPFGATVGGLVPRGFPAYARILHRLQVTELRATADPADPRPDDHVVRLARWTEAATERGAVVHPLAQLWRVLRLADPWGRDERWDTPPGQLDAAQLPTLLDVLAAHTERGADAEVVAALWEGYGWIQGGSAVVRVTLGPDGTTTEHPPPAFPADVMAAPRLELPHRAYLLFRGPLAGVRPFFAAGDSGFWGQTPNLLWPADRTWCVATEIDLDSTVVGGPRALIEGLTTHPDLEAFVLDEGDSLMADGDTVNT